MSFEVAPDLVVERNNGDDRKDALNRQPDPLRRKALALLCVAFFMVILDAQIVILGLPSIDADLGLSSDAGQWLIGAYLFSFGGLLLLGGRSADLLGAGAERCP
jgi:hypothetical protein